MTAHHVNSTPSLPLPRQGRINKKAITERLDAMEKTVTAALEAHGDVLKRKQAGWVTEYLRNSTALLEEQETPPPPTQSGGAAKTM